MIKIVLYHSVDVQLVLSETDIQSLSEPPHDKTNKMECAPSEDSDKPGHPLSLISLHCPHEETMGP